MADNKKITLKLLVDKSRTRVVLAESGKEFVDILLSFLTMPMGTIIRLLDRDPAVGCIVNLYESVESLDSQHLQTQACRNMLLHPLNAAARHCQNLLVSIDDTSPTIFFTCPESDCCSKGKCFYSSVPNVLCSCGKQMSQTGRWQYRDLQAAEDGAFIKGGLMFIITDELQITPASTAIMLSLFNKLGIRGGSMLEEIILEIGSQEILKLLRSTLTSNTPLTDLCFSENNTNVANSGARFQLVPKPENDGDSELKEVKMKLLVTKSNDKVIYMECGEELADLLLSFLILPLGCVIKLLGRHSSMGCVDELYGSVENLSLQGNDCIKSEQCKEMLHSPKLPPFFSVKMQPLKIEEMASKRASITGCYLCFRKSAKQCDHAVETAEFKELNPKSSPDRMTEPGGGYAKGPCKFIVTDDLHIAPLSPIFAFGIINESKVPITNLVEKEVIVRETQALNLLKAALSSETATLTKVFCPKKKRRSVA